MAKRDMFLKLEGIDGESNDEKKTNQIEIDSWSFGGSNAASFDFAKGGGVSKVNLQDIHFTKSIDKAMPNLFGSLAVGAHIDKATLTCRKAGGDPTGGTPKEYLTITLTPCFISSWQISGHEGSIPQESFSLNYDKIEIDYKTQDDKGNLGPSIKKSYETSKNKAS